MKGKILYLASSAGLTLDQSGGAGTHMRGAIRGFRENGYEVLPVIEGDIMRSVTSKDVQSELKTPGSNKLRDFIKRNVPDKFRLFVKDIRILWNDYLFTRKAKKLIRDFKPDAIYERASYLSMFGMRMAKQLGIPHFYETDGSMVEIINKDYGVFSVFFGNIIERKKFRQADYIVVMNNLTIPGIVDKFKLKDKEFIVKSLGVEIDKFNYDESKVRQIKSKYNLENKFVVGFVGAILTYHRVDLLIEAAKYLKQAKVDSVSVFIIGWSKEAENLKKIAEENECDNIVFTGKVNKSEVANYYRVLDVGVVPDSEETMYPIKILEYGIFDICPLVPRYPVFADIILPEYSGCFFQPLNANSLYTEICNMNKEKEKSRNFGTNWGHFVRNNFQWKNTVYPVVEKLAKS